MASERAATSVEADRAFHAALKAFPGRSPGTVLQIDSSATLLRSHRPSQQVTVETWINFIETRSVGRASRAAGPLQIFFEQLSSCRERARRRPCRAVNSQELLEIPLHRSCLLSQGFVEPFLRRREARPFAESGRQIYFAPLRVPARAGEFGKRTKERRNESCDSSIGLLRFRRIVCDQHRADGYCLDRLLVGDQRRIIIRAKAARRIAVSQRLSRRRGQQTEASIFRERSDKAQRLAAYQNEARK